MIFTERVILHCDMNNFYASVECMLDPALREHAVAVCGSVENRHGVVLAKNYRARAYGVSTGETVWQAMRKCRDLVTVEPHYEQYVKFSALARQIYCRYTDRVEPYGMDECWLDVTGSRIMGTGPEIADEIRQTVKAELGLTISAGVSFNKVFAKLSSDMKKPDAVTCIGRDSFRERIWSLPASDMLGVGRAANRALSAYGIHTIGQIAAAPDSFMQRLLGVNGLLLKRFANGEDNAPVMHIDSSPPVKSVGHGITTARDLETPGDVWRIMLELSQDIGPKLRSCRKMAGGVEISIRDNALFTRQWQHKADFPTQSPLYLARAAFALFNAGYSWQRPVRAVTVRAIDLVDEGSPVQCDLFNDAAHTQKQERLDLAVDSIRARFGKQAVKNAVLLNDIKMPSDRKVELTMPTGMFS